MKDDRKITLSRTLIDLALRYRTAFSDAKNTHRTLRQLLDAFYESTKSETNQTLGRPFCPIQLMELLFKIQEIQKKWKGEILPTYLFFLITSFIITGAYSFIFDPGMNIKWVISATFGWPIIPCIWDYAIIAGKQQTYHKLVVENSSILYKFVDSLQVLGNNFCIISRDRFHNDTLFGDFAQLRRRADARLLDCAKWVLVCTKMYGDGSLEKYQAERLFGLTYDGLDRFRLTKSGYKWYYDEARKEIATYEGNDDTAGTGMLGTKVVKVFTMMRPDNLLLT